MLDLTALVLFAKVVEAGSFSEAARRLKMPNSTVSRRVAELEDKLGVRLLERSTRHLRLTDIGAEVLEQAQRTIELSEAVDGIVSNQIASVGGTLRLSSPPSISDSVLAPIVSAFQASYPQVRFEILVTERLVDPIAEGVDLSFHVGPLKDSSVVSRPLLRYRHQLVASPAYVARARLPTRPQDLIDHPIMAFSHWRPQYQWQFSHVNGRDSEVVVFRPQLGMNDFAGLAVALVNGLGIGDLPPVVLPHLMRDGLLVEVMPDWHFPTFDLSLIHLRNRYIARPVRIFKEFAAEMAPTLFPILPI